MYTKAAALTIEIPLFDSNNDPITSGTVTTEISKDSVAYVATTNSAVHVDEELWTLALTTTETNCDRFRVRVTHDDLAADVIVSDDAWPTVDANIVKVGGYDVELMDDIDVDADTIATACAAAILEEPANKLLTNALGYVYCVGINSGVDTSSSSSTGSGSGFYAVMADMELIFGEVNIAKWADIDNDADTIKITERVAWALRVSEAWVNDRLREGPYVVPFTSVPTIITDITARNAGVLLYDARRITDEGNDVDEVSFHRRYVEQALGQILARQLKLNVDTTYTAYPKSIA